MTSDSAVREHLTPVAYVDELIHETIDKRELSQFEPNEKPKTGQLD